MEKYTLKYTGKQIDYYLDTVKKIFDLTYPVGSIYMNLHGINPRDLFGVGTWERIEGRFLLGAGQLDNAHNYIAGSTGGEPEVQLTVNELPHIEGNIQMHGVNRGTPVASANGVFRGGAEQSSYAQPTSSPDAGSFANINLNFGGDQAHNNMPPYFVVCMWLRTA